MSQPWKQLPAFRLLSGVQPAKRQRRQRTATAHPPAVSRRGHPQHTRAAHQPTDPSHSAAADPSPHRRQPRQTFTPSPRPPATSGSYGHGCAERSAGIITEADITHAIADGKDVNDTWVDAVMTTRPAVITTTSIRDTAKIMTARHFRHLPVASDAGLLGVVDIIDVCRALINAA